MRLKLTQRCVSTMCACVLSHFSRIQLSATLWIVPARVLCPWDSPGKNTWQACSLSLARPGKPKSTILQFLKTASFSLFLQKVDLPFSELGTTGWPLHGCISLCSVRWALGFLRHPWQCLRCLYMSTDVSWGCISSQDHFPFIYILPRYPSRLSQTHLQTLLSPELNFWVLPNLSLQKTKQKQAWFSSRAFIQCLALLSSHPDTWAWAWTWPFSPAHVPGRTAL